MLHDSNIVTEPSRHVVCNLTIETLGDANALLAAENAVLRSDLAHCREVIVASVQALHKLHQRALKRDEQFFRLLAEFRTQRSQLADSGSLATASASRAA